MNTELPTFLGFLEAFNRKERFFVVADATGATHPGKAAFRLSPDFRQRLGKAVGFEIPEDALAFMDYHLEWLHAAAVLSRRAEGWSAQAIDQAPERVSHGNQEDIDLVVAFETLERTEVILLEAKAETGWTNSQLNSKGPRLKAIFGECGDAVPGVHPSFCLWSPSDTTGLDYKGWPEWCRKDIRHHWMKLSVTPNRRVLFGSDAAGKANRDRTHWHTRWSRVDEPAGEN